jgi:protein-L-isoaspartate(D-aspartate) O-methyltransferase
VVERTDFEDLRLDMVERQIVARGIRAPRILAAMRKVKREAFVPRKIRDYAYEDRALSIEEGQTISQPYIVALMIDALELEPRDRVLEIGTGSGYAAAVMAELVDEVFTMERLEWLGELAQKRLVRNGYERVHVRMGDGTLGWPEEAPFDAISVAACGPSIPSSLQEQLAIGGRMVLPVGKAIGDQRLVRVTRVGAEDYVEEGLGKVRFVPLVGEEGVHP